MKKTLLALSLLAAAAGAHAGFAAGFSRSVQDMAAMNSMDPAPTRVIIENAPAAKPTYTPIETITRVTLVTMIPDADKVTLHCRYSDGSVKSVGVAAACPAPEQKW